MLGPAANGFEKARVQLLEGLGLFGELLAEPLHGGRLVVDEEIELQHFFDGHALAIVLGDLIGEEIDAVAFGETLIEPSVKFGGREWDGDASLDMEGDHSIKEEVVLTFGNDFCMALIDYKNR